MPQPLLQACATGAFCVVFALVVDAVTDALSLLAVILLSFSSGFLGSMVAQWLVRRGLRQTSATPANKRA